MVRFYIVIVFNIVVNQLSFLTRNKSPFLSSVRQDVRQHFSSPCFHSAGNRAITLTQEDENGWLLVDVAFHFTCQRHGPANALTSTTIC